MSVDCRSYRRRRARTEADRTSNWEISWLFQCSVYSSIICYSRSLKHCGCVCVCLKHLAVFLLQLVFRAEINWIAPWKNRISFTTMKLKKSLVKPVTRQNISRCLVLLPEIFMHDALMLFYERPPTCVIVHDDLGWRNRTTWYNCMFSGTTLALRVIFCPLKMSADICVVHDDLGWKNRATHCNRFWRAGCSRLEYIDVPLVYWPNN